MNVLPIYAALIFMFSQPLEREPVTLSEAIRTGLVSINVQASDGSTHYLKPITIEVQNLKNEIIPVKIECGYIFNPADTDFQSFMVNNTVMYVLAPNQKKTDLLSAMCIKHHKAAPDDKAPYKLGKMATGKLADIGKYIEKNQYFSSAGQRAVWVISDNDPLDYVESFDSQETKNLVAYLSSITGKPIPPPPAPEDYMRNLSSKPRVVSIGGDFEFTFSRIRKIHIAMFDKNNIVVRELYSNPAQPSGYKKVEYEFDASVYNDPFYYIRLIADDKVLLESKVDTH